MQPKVKCIILTLITVKMFLLQKNEHTYKLIYYKKLLRTTEIFFLNDKYIFFLEVTRDRTAKHFNFFFFNFII